MKKVIYTCDKCDKEVSTTYALAANVEANFLVNPLKVVIDLCHDCYKKASPTTVSPKVIEDFIKKLFI
jgi:hypothetical protein